MHYFNNGIESVNYLVSNSLCTVTTKIVDKALDFIAITDL